MSIYINFIFVLCIHWLRDKMNVHCAWENLPFTFWEAQDPMASRVLLPDI